MLYRPDHSNITSIFGALGGLPITSTGTRSVEINASTEIRIGFENAQTLKHGHDVSVIRRLLRKSMIPAIDDHIHGIVMSMVRSRLRWDTSQPHKLYDIVRPDTRANTRRRLKNKKHDIAYWPDLKAYRQKAIKTKTANKYLDLHETCTMHSSKQNATK